MAKSKTKKTKSKTNFGTWLLHSKISLANTIVFSLLLLILPGQNAFQVMSLSPQESPITPLPFDIPPQPDVPISTKQLPPPVLSAKAYYVYDPLSSAVLAEKNPTAKLLPASTTKIMTALVAMQEYHLNDVVTIVNANQSIGHKAQIQSQEQMLVADLIKAMLISSGNDAALALAQHHPQGYQAFIQLMNQKAADLYLNNTHYTNVSGVETPGHYSSVQDLTLLAKEAMKQPFFQEVVGTQSTTITDITGSTSHNLVNINQLLGKVEGVKGIKTGWTQNAGECLVAFSDRDGHQIITVVLGSIDRFGESEQLIEWAYNNFSWVSIDQILKSFGY